MDQDTSRDKRAFVAPLVSTLLTLPMALVALFFAGLSPMACDSCGEAASDRFDASFGIAFPVFGAGLLLVLVLLVTSWALPWQRRNSARRITFALLAPAAVVLDYIVFAGIID
ncbi:MULTISPECIES: hypothetical protein [unclassified Streptomyces]|uniref:hypothetical protein n=1 Tax=unclassified Streptomyces TaxID=2593676 RepID=UPI0022552151|nr:MULTISPECIES: hypothetical protein [unclassified Streptomyces]MCX4628344.1 hypothetical protein [Streptomyces sp. NBC_01443]WSW44404.1 hypothetical protein OG296_15380 [Streptomyces sp. NBC_01001]